jgi:hypothetical protein
MYGTVQSLGAYTLFDMDDVSGVGLCLGHWLPRWICNIILFFDRWKFGVDPGTFGYQISTKG